MNSTDYAAIDALPVATRERLMNLIMKYGQAQFRAGQRSGSGYSIEEFFAANTDTNTAHDAVLAFLYPLSFGVMPTTDKD